MMPICIFRCVHSFSVACQQESKLPRGTFSSDHQMFCVFLIMPSRDEGSKLAQESSADVMAGDRASGKAWRIKTPSPGKGISQGSAICHRLVSACCVHVQRS